MLRPPTAASSHFCQAAWHKEHCLGPPASHRPRPAGRKPSHRQHWGKKDAPVPASIQRPCWAPWDCGTETRAVHDGGPVLQLGQCHHSPGVWCVAVLCLCSVAAPAPRCASCQWGWAGDMTRTTSATAQQSYHRPTPPDPISDQTCRIPQNWGPIPVPIPAPAAPRGANVTAGFLLAPEVSNFCVTAITHWHNSPSLELAAGVW